MLRLVLSLLLVAGVSFGQITKAPGTGAGGGTGNVSASGAPVASQSAQWTDATHVKGVSQGVFNVRTMYGAVPDGSTDNATAITSAFTASNAMTTGIPTVYFDCDTSSATCQYNYGGSGTSAINPLVPTNVECATGVTLNYTGTAHAVDLGPSNLTQVNTDRYTVQGCRFTGGASYTAGIYANNWLANVHIHRNTFWNFGNQTSYSIVFPGNNWTPVVDDNYWRDTDGFTRNMVDASSGSNVGLLFTNNKNECETSTGTACSVVTTGVGVISGAGWISDNEIKYHYPAVRIVPTSYQLLMISGNVLEGNIGGAKPAITYGTPGGTGVHINQHTSIINNGFYWPNAASSPPYLAAETAGSGIYTLDNVTFANNHLQSTLPSGVTSWLNFGTGDSIYAANNRNATTLITSASPTPLTERPATLRQTVNAYNGNGTSIAGKIPVGDSTGVNVSAAMFHHFASPLLCPDSSGSGTVQTCNTTPKFDITGTALTAVAGDLIIYKTTTTNTADLTIAVNSGTAIHVRKNAGANTLAAGDLKSGVYYPLTFDGTYWEMPSYATAVPTSCTGLPSGALFNSSGTASFCP